MPSYSMSRIRAERLLIIPLSHNPRHNTTPPLQRFRPVKPAPTPEAVFESCDQLRLRKMG
ncbi:Uncharacterised protein [Vibrio cholerae]|nr:Uncharacterised protein [Vibrio cholerae]